MDKISEGDTMQRVQLGKTGLIVSKLAIGTGTNGWGYASDQTRKGFDWLVNLLKLGYELGVNFWDLADQYGSHKHAKEALKGINREDIVITSKTIARDYRACLKDVERFLREIGTDYLDVVLLHAKGSGDWNVKFRGPMDALSEAKDKGLVRAVGISSHSFEALKTAASEPWVDVILVRINYAGVNMDAPPEWVIPVLERAHNAGKGIYAMKVLGCGPLTSDPERAIRYVMGLGCVDAMTIGHTDHAHLRRNVEIISP
jgi:aryl-alcohol dehydrogenase-like predicted oxidoreductase